MGGQLDLEPICSAGQCVHRTSQVETLQNQLPASRCTYRALCCCSLPTGGALSFATQQPLTRTGTQSTTYPTCHETHQIEFLLGCWISQYSYRRRMSTCGKPDAALRSSGHLSVGRTRVHTARVTPRLLAPINTATSKATSRTEEQFLPHLVYETTQRSLPEASGAKPTESFQTGSVSRARPSGGVCFIVRESGNIPTDGHAQRSRRLS